MAATQSRLFAQAKTSSSGGLYNDEDRAMPRFAANLSTMFTEVPFLDRFDMAANAGFSGVEFLFPYDHAAEEVRRRLADNNLSLVLFNMPPGDWAGGERGLACLPGRREEFRDGVRRALDYAHRLECGLIHCMAGIAPRPRSDVETAARYVTNLDWACEQAQAARVRLAIEPINQRDIPGYHLATLEQAAALVEALGADRLGLQFDVYHAQISQGDLTHRLETLMPITAHVQIADVPGRHEPGTGEIGWAHLFARLDALGYQGWVGCEYHPAAGTLAGLAWINQFGLAGR